MLNYSVNDFEGVRTLVLSGSLTAGSIDNFREIAEPLAQKESIIINVENINLITTAGLNVLVDLSFYAKDYGKRVIILWADNEMKHMAETIGVYHYLIFAESIDEAKVKIKYFT